MLRHPNIVRTTIAAEMSWKQGNTMEIAKVGWMSGWLDGATVFFLYIGVSKNKGTPKIIHFNRGFHYKPSILGYPNFWKHPYTWDSLQLHL